MSKILELNDVCFAYDKHNKVLNHVDFTINSHDFVAIIGPNGSGKSTLLKLILNELTADDGQLLLFNQAVNSRCNYQAVGYVPQNVGLIYQQFVASVEEVIATSLNTSVKKIESELLKVLDEVGMSSHRKDLIFNLSGGQMQRIAIAKALLSKPKFLILDEPTAGIDKKSAKKLYGILQKLSQKGVSILMVTHDLAGCESYINRVLCLEDSNICELSKADVLQELSHKHVHPVE